MRIKYLFSCGRYTFSYSQGVQIEWRNKARKQLKKLRNPLAIPRILTVIEDFAAGKACDVEALVDHADTHRLRVGDFRVLMTIDGW